MSPRSARAVSTAVVGGLAAMVFFRIGLFFWVGIVGWAVLAEAGDDPAAMKKTLGGTLFGAALAWVALLISLFIPVPPDGWMWVPRLAAMVALSMYLLEMGAGVDLFSGRLARMAGYASLFGAAAITVAGDDAAGQYTAAHLSNPLIATVVALVLGAVAGVAAKSMEKALG